jgi:hypothetical protein
MLFGTWSASAELIRQDNPSTFGLRVGGRACSMLAMLYLLWVWGRGGRLRDYFWPAPIRFLREGWRGSFWVAAYERFWRMLEELEVGRLFWLGLRGFLGTTLWIAIPALILIGATRNGETGAAGLVGVFGGIGMGIVLIYLPYLQVAMAADNRLWSIFGVRRVRLCFRRCPLAFWFGLLTTFGLAIPPYLLKVEAVPREYAWIMAAIVGSFVLPARFVTGWAMARASQREEPRGSLLFAYRCLIRILILPVIGFYLVILFVTQFTSWYGLAGTWFLQHAISVPTPFNGT